MSSSSISDTLTSIQNNTAKVTAEKNKSNVGNSTMTGDEFLQLLMTQLKYQDPLNPMDTDQFTTQQAQLQQVTELQSLNKTLASSNSMMQASSLIGKDVTLTDPDDDTKTITGTVSEAKISDGEASVVIGNTSYPLDLVVSIKDASASSSTSGS